MYLIATRNRLVMVAFFLFAGLISIFSSVPLFGQAAAPDEFREMVPGLLGRTLFKAEAGTSAIEIMDILVGPEKLSEPISLNGGALLDVQGGEAAVIIDGRARRVKAGEVISMAQNQTVAIDNRRAQRSFVARLILLSRPGG